MADPKYDIFDLRTGKMEDLDVDHEEFFDKLAAKLAEESARLYQMYRAEREIVQSILKKAELEQDE